MQNDNKQVLARMFFENQTIETRPLDWVIFTTADKFTSNITEVKATLANKSSSNGEVFIAFTNQMTGIQLFEGSFVNVRESKQADHFNSRR